ncbi:MAG: hypothetical protein LBD36_00195 [Holosporales bacterium]|jgi:hypothetical protein|nr:hypothetical protein [Holosporales bacterium]
MFIRNVFVLVMFVLSANSAKPVPTQDINKQITNAKSMCVAFLTSPDDQEIILRNYSDAVQSCRAALATLANAKSCNFASKGRFDIDVRSNRRAFNDHLRFFTDETAMARLVAIGQIPQYIFDVVKRYVFDRAEAHE